MNGETFAFERDPHSRDRSDGPRLVAITNMDFDQVDRNLKLTEQTQPRSAAADAMELAKEQAPIALRELLAFCFANEKLRPSGRGMKGAVVKFVAIAWHVSPELLRNE